MSVDSSLADLVSAHNPPVGARMRASAGLNFGSRFLVGHTTLPTNQKLPLASRQVATDIIAFDALLENVDRRQDNPNLLIQGDSIRAFDHELAFGFIYDISPNRSWVERFSFLSGHALYASLRGRDLDFSRFLGALASVNDEDLEAICKSIPEEFGTSYLERICDHIRLASSQTHEFALALHAVLR